MADTFLIPNMTIRSPEVMVSTQMAMVMAPIRMMQSGVERSELRVPISPTAEPNGTEVFENPIGGRQLFLPAYEIAEHAVDGQQRFEIAFHHDAPRERWGLRIALDKLPPALLANSASRMEPMAHEITVSLSFIAGPARREMTFETERITDARAELVLWFANIAERDLVYQALKTPETEARLNVTRHIEIAVEANRGGRVSLENGGRLNQLANLRGTHLLQPNVILGQPVEIARPVEATRVLTPARAEVIGMHREFPGGILAERFRDIIVLAQPNGDVLPRPEAEQTGFRRIQAGRSDGAEVELTITNLNAFGRELFKQLPGSGKQPARLMIEVTDARTGELYLRDGMRGTGAPYNPRTLRFFGTGVSVPEAVIVTMRDVQRNRVTRSNKIGLKAEKPAPQKLYSLMEIDLPLTISPEPFHFDETTHAYLYEALNAAPPVPVQGGLARHREEFEGMLHSYFQDAITPHRIYFLPDAFKIARHDRAFKSPQVTVRVATDEEGEATVTMDYVISPVVNAERLGKAAMKLADATGLDAATLEFQPYLTEELSYVLSRPSTTGRISEDRPVSQLMLQEPMVDTLVLSQEEFQIVFDAMVGETASTITGEVRFEVEGWGQETRGVTLDFRDLVGEAYSINVQQGTDPHLATVFLTNAIESGIRLEGLRIAVDRDGLRQPIEEMLDTISADHVLLPGQDIDPEVRFDGLPGTGSVNATVLQIGVVEPDPQAVLDAILDRSAMEYHRTITVRTVPTLFPDPATTTDDKALFAIMVEFDTGQAIALDAATHEVEVTIDFPFADVILGREVGAGGYRYRKTIIRRDGTQESDAEFIEDNKDLLFVTPVVTPAPIVG